MKYILTNYEADCSWVRDYTDDFLVYDRSECGLENRIPRDNVGDADFDRLTYIVDNYDNLPEVFLLSKSNLFKYISRPEFDSVKDNQVFTPLLTQNHKTYADAQGTVCFYREEIYWERNNSWYLNSVPALNFKSFDEWAGYFHLPNPDYIPFAPGGNYILTRDTVHKHPKSLYHTMRQFLPYTQRPGEAQLVERSLYLLWS